MRIPDFDLFLPSSYYALVKCCHCQEPQRTTGESQPGTRQTRAPYGVDKSHPFVLLVEEIEENQTPDTTTLRKALWTQLHSERDAFTLQLLPDPFPKKSSSVSTLVLCKPSAISDNLLRIVMG